VQVSFADFQLEKKAGLITLHLFLSCLWPCFSSAQSRDSLRVAIYHKGEFPTQLPEVFPQHRPFKLLLHVQAKLNSRATTLQIADTLAAVQKLAGLQYYSHSEKKMKLLFKESARIEHPHAHAPLPSPVFRKLPIDTTFYIRQVDNRIGPAVYRTTLRADSVNVTFFLYNVFPASKLGLQLVESGDFLLYIAVQRTRAGELELNAWQWQRFKDGILGLFVKEESFVNRLKAVAGFYQKALLEK